jgi:hypothetical protein
VNKLTVSNLQEIVEEESDNLKNLHSIQSYQEINNGYCGILARSIIDTVRDRYGNKYLIWRKDSDYPTLTKNTYGCDELTNASHIWIEFKSLHFDAECTKGVNRAYQLPIFQRNNIKP